MKLIAILKFEPTPSLNETRRWHWAKRAKLKSQYLAMIAAQHPEWVRCPTDKRKLVITRYGKRKLDYDNLCGGSKALIDALVTAGFIADDNPDAVDLVFEQAGRPDDGQWRTEVAVWE